MTTKLKEALAQHEALVRSSQISTFNIFLQREGLLIKSAGSEAGQVVPLVQEMHASLLAFFCGVESIEYGSCDYVTLQNFINDR